MSHTNPTISCWLRVRGQPFGQFVTPIQNCIIDMLSILQVYTTRSDRRCMRNPGLLQAYLRVCH